MRDLIGFGTNHEAYTWNVYTNDTIDWLTRNTQRCMYNERRRNKLSVLFTIRLADGHVEIFLRIRVL